MQRQYSKKVEGWLTSIIYQNKCSPFVKNNIQQHHFYKMEASEERPAEAPLSSSAIPESSASVVPRWSVDSIMGRCRCWGKWWFTMIVILSWVILIGLLGLGVYCGIQWKNTDSDYSTAKSENERVVKELNQLTANITAIKAEINEKSKELETEQKTLKELKEEHANKSNSYHQLEEQLGKIKSDLDATVKERDMYKDENEKLVEKNKKTQEQVHNLTNEVNTMHHQVKLSEEESNIFKYATFAVGGVLGVGITDSILTHIKLADVESKLAKLHQYRAGFEKLAAGFENYELLQWKYGKTVHRETCFSGDSKTDLEKCNDKGPTITTISTTDGYKFGAVLFQPWKSIDGPFEDSKAYTFSDNLGETTTINDPKHARVVREDNFLQFGEGDIEIERVPKKGKAHGKTYTVPHPYTDTTFYYNGTEYPVDKILVETIALQ